MPKIYVSDTGDDKNDGLSDQTPIRSWKRVLELKSGNDKIWIWGIPAPVKLRLTAEVEKKKRKRK